jgi:hypothetical protein
MRVSDPPMMAATSDAASCYAVYISDHCLYSGRTPASSPMIAQAAYSENFVRYRRTVPLD